MSICLAVRCSIADNFLKVEGGMKLAEAFAKMPNLRKVNCMLAPSCAHCPPMKPLDTRPSPLAWFGILSARTARTARTRPTPKTRQHAILLGITRQTDRMCIRKGSIVCASGSIEWASETSIRKHPEASRSEESEHER
eukprot:7031698-Prymnesium_polylepis.1